MEIESKIDCKSILGGQEDRGIMVTNYCRSTSAVVEVNVCFVSIQFCMYGYCIYYSTCRRYNLF